MEGWIKLHRKFLTWEWFNEPNTLLVFLYFLLRANSKAGKWRGHEIKRGQLITGQLQISKHTGLSRQIVRTCIERLKLTNEITVKATNQFSIVTICKYVDYQDNNSTHNQQTNQQTNKRLTNNQPTTNHKQEGYKKVEKDERRKEEGGNFSNSPPKYMIKNY